MDELPAMLQTVFEAPKLFPVEIPHYSGDYLYHYTKIETLLKICSSKTLHMTRTDYLEGNDRQEILHFFTVLHELARDMNVPELTDLQPFEFRYIYVLSLSYNPDSDYLKEHYTDDCECRLRIHTGTFMFNNNNWEDQRYSKNFMPKSDIGRLRMGKVIYEEREQRSLISRMIDRYIQETKGKNDFQRKSILFAFKSIVNNCAPFFKRRNNLSDLLVMNGEAEILNREYWKEEEVRLVLMQHELSQTRVKSFMDNNGKIIKQYIEFPLYDEQRDKGNVAKMLNRFNDWCTPCCSKFPPGHFPPSARL